MNEKNRNEVFKKQVKVSKPQTGRFSHPHTQITYVVSGAFAFTIGDETRTVRAGDTMLKEDGVVHGCTCLEAGVLLDIFTPMREDFVTAP